MKTRELTQNHDSKKMTLLKMAFIALIIALSIAGNALFGQEAIKLQPKSKGFKTVETFVNAQGFRLPVSVSDTTRVYKIGDNGTPFYFRRSKKSGSIYKVYIKKDSTSLTTANK